MFFQAFRMSAVSSFAVFSVVANSLSAEEALSQVNQLDLNALVASGDSSKAFEDAFEAGDELTEFAFTATQGVGANIGEGRRFTRIPRADLNGETEWSNHFPKREGGANATSCIACHNAPLANGAGDVALNAIVDPAHTGNPALYLERNTLPLFALGIPQRLAEEISLELQEQKSLAAETACTNGTATAQLSAKGVSYGRIDVMRISSEPCELEYDTAALDGVDPDLVVKPFGWKGNHATIRGFTRGAAHNELGMQAVELVGDKDGDFDGVINELTVGDMTALTIYMAGLERPVSTLELAAIGLEDMTDAQRQMIRSGEQRFSEVGCSSCHTPTMEMEDPVFREPSTTPGFFDDEFPDGSSPASHGLTPEFAIEFDMTSDQPNNRFDLQDGSVAHLGSMETTMSGSPFARWFTDFKRHDMGPDLADPSDPLETGASVFLTRSLAGVGSTGPWLHDGRATTLHEAIVVHGGEAEASKRSYEALSSAHQEEIISFLESLVIYVEDANEH